MSKMWWVRSCDTHPERRSPTWEHQRTTRHSESCRPCRKWPRVPSTWAVASPVHGWREKSFSARSHLCERLTNRRLTSVDSQFTLSEQVLPLVWPSSQWSLLFFCHSPKTRIPFSYIPPRQLYIHLLLLCNDSHPFERDCKYKTAGKQFHTDALTSPLRT